MPRAAKTPLCIVQITLELSFCTVKSSGRECIAPPDAGKKDSSNAHDAESMDSPPNMPYHHLLVDLNPVIEVPPDIQCLQRTTEVKEDEGRCSVIRSQVEHNSMSRAKDSPDAVIGSHSSELMLLLPTSPSLSSPCRVGSWWLRCRHPSTVP